MDRRLIDVQGIMQTGNVDSAPKYKLKILLDVYGPPSSRLQLAPHLSFFGLISDTGIPPSESEPGTQISGTSRSPHKGKGKSRLLDGETDQERQARIIMEGLKQLDKGDAKTDAIMDTLTRSKDVLMLPLHPDPPSKRLGQLKNDLLVTVDPLYSCCSKLTMFIATPVTRTSLDAATRESYSTYRRRNCPAMATQGRPGTALAECRD